MKSNKVVIKPGTTDLRRQENTLLELAKRSNSDGVKPNTIYAFSNKNKTAIKMVKVNNDSSITMVKIKRENPYPWPEYQHKGNEGAKVELEGEKKNEFMENIGCPEDL